MKKRNLLFGGILIVSALINLSFGSSNNYDNTLDLENVQALATSEMGKMCRGTGTLDCEGVKVYVVVEW